jgi:hypothetical protein
MSIKITTTAFVMVIIRVFLEVSTYISAQVAKE